MSIPISQFIPPPPPRHFPPLVSIRLFSTSVSQFLPCKLRTIQSLKCNPEHTWNMYLWTLFQGLGGPCLSKLFTSFHLLLYLHQSSPLECSSPLLIPAHIDALPLGMRAASLTKPARFPAPHSQHPVFSLPSSHHTLQWPHVWLSPRVPPLLDVTAPPLPTKGRVSGWLCSIGPAPPRYSALNMQVLINVYRMDWMNLSVIHSVQPN